SRRWPAGYWARRRWLWRGGGVFRGGARCCFFEWRVLGWRMCVTSLCSGFSGRSRAPHPPRRGPGRGCAPPRGPPPPAPPPRGTAQLARPARTPGVLAAIALGIVVSVPVLLRPIDRSGDAVTPQSALAAARGLHLAGPVFNSEAFGGYLTFSGVPTFIDGRVEL